MKNVIGIALSFLSAGSAVLASGPWLPQSAARYTFDAEVGVIERDADGFGPDAVVVRDGLGRPLSVREPGLFGLALRPTERGFVKTAFPAGRQFTVSFWIKADRNSVDGLFRCGDEVLISLNRAHPRLHARVGPGQLSGPFTVGEWLHVGLRGDGEKAALFLDGVKAGEVDAKLAKDPRGLETRMANIGGAHHQFAGLFDEARIYDQALTDEQMARLADRENALAGLPPSVDAGVDHTFTLERRLFFTQKARLSLAARVTGSAGGNIRWTVLSAPKGAGVRFDDAAAADTLVTLNTPGDYVLAVEASNGNGRARDLVRIAVFAPPGNGAGMPAENPLTPGAVGVPERKAWGREPVYDPEFVQKWFPLIPPGQRREGFDASRFSPPPAVGRHPRIFFGPDDLPDMRRRLRDTRAGRAARVKLESIMQMALGDLSPDKPLPPYFSLGADNKGKPKHVVDCHVAAIYCYSAFLALIDADGQRARQVIDGAMRVAVDQLAAIAAVPPEKRDDWGGTYHNILGRYATSYVYDFLHAWMNDDERATLRKVISACTANKWSIGMFSVNGHGTSNWQCWVTGDLLANILSIEGEEGFDPVVYEEAANAMRRFWRNGLFADGAMFEGMGKNAVTAQNLMALAKRGDTTISSIPVYNHVAKFILHTMQPYGYQIIEDDLWGGSRARPLMSDVAVLKYAYPDDPVIDFAYRNTAGDDYNWTPNGNTYSYGSDLVACWTALDWQGDPDRDRNAQAALKDEPLDYFFRSINLVAARTGWLGDEAYLYFLPRMLGGHVARARGTFVFSALGRDWTLYPTGHNHKSSLQHSVITVDGLSAGAQWSRMLAIESTPRAMIARCDLREPYSRMSPPDTTLDHYRLGKSAEPWTALPLAQLPHWFDGDRPADAVPAPTGRLVNAAFRTAVLVRSPQPHALIVDDFDMDGQEHLYRWQMVLPPDLAEAAVIDGTRAEITDPATGNRLLVRMLRGNGEVAGKVETIGKDIGGHTVIAFETRAVKPDFAFLLTPLRPGESVPDASLDGNRLRVGGETILIETGAEKGAGTAQGFAR